MIHSDFPFTDIGRTVGLRKVFEYVAETDISEIDIKGLDLERDKVYIIIFNIKNPTGTSSAYRLFCNGDFTLTNYWFQWGEISGGVLSSSRQNTNQFAYVDAGQNAHAETTIGRSPDGYPQWFTRSCRGIGGAIMIHLVAGCWMSTANVTRLTIRSEVTNAIGAGSRLVIYSLF